LIVLKLTRRVLVCHSVCLMYVTAVLTIVKIGSRVTSVQGETPCHSKLRNTYVDWLNTGGHEEGKCLECSLFVLPAFFP
jgi:hypothetical protein